MLLGVPLDTSSFAALAQRLADRHTVITLDPRGFSRSSVADPDADCIPQMVADDVHRLLDEVAASGPVEMFGTSGGTIAGLALVAEHPEQVRTLVVHEPPLVEMLPEDVRQRGQDAAEDVYATFRNAGAAAAWVKFLAPNGFDQPPPQDSSAPPATPPTEQEQANGDRMLAHWMRPCIRFRPDLSALRCASTRIVAGLGDATRADQLVRRTTTALVTDLDIPMVAFPGGHTGFISDPERFAEALQRTFDETL